MHIWKDATLEKYNYDHPISKKINTEQENDEENIHENNQRLNYLPEKWWCGKKLADEGHRIEVYKIIQSTV